MTGPTPGSPKYIATHYTRWEITSKNKQFVETTLTEASRKIEQHYEEKVYFRIVRKLYIVEFGRDHQQRLGVGAMLLTRIPFS